MLTTISMLPGSGPACLVMVPQVLGTLQVLRRCRISWRSEVSHLVNRGFAENEGDWNTTTYFAPLKFVAVAELIKLRVIFPIWEEEISIKINFGFHPGVSG